MHRAAISLVLDTASGYWRNRCIIASGERSAYLELALRCRCEVSRSRLCLMAVSTSCNLLRDLSWYTTPPVATVGMDRLCAACVSRRLRNASPWT